MGALTLLLAAQAYMLPGDVGSVIRTTPRHSVPRCAEQLDDFDAKARVARSTLLAEIGEEERSIPAITGHLATLEAAAPVPGSGKLKRLMVGDWKMLFASSEAAVQPFLSGGSNGQFNVLEDVFVRTTESRMQSTEVIRKIGPFGNVAQSLHGRLLLDKASLVWDPQFLVDTRYREVDPPSGSKSSKWAIAHVSAELLVLRRDGDAASFVVLSKLAKGKLKKELTDLSVEAEAILSGEV